jgi:hypothetical protein
MPVTAQKPCDVLESQRSALRRDMLVPGLAVLRPRPAVAALLSAEAAMALDRNASITATHAR